MRNGRTYKKIWAQSAVYEIEVMDAKETNNAPLYDLTGRRLVAPPAKGVYIEGGKKRVVR